MVVLTNECLPHNHQKLRRKCLKCKTAKWPGEFETIYAKRCIECRDALALSKCQHCGGPTGADKNPRKYCLAPECQQACYLERARIGGSRRSARVAESKTKRCPACGKSKPRTVEHFNVAERNPDGSLKRLMGLCRPCKRAYDAALYAMNDAVRERARDRNRKRYQLSRTRMEADPEYAAKVRAQGAERARRRKQRLREESFRATDTRQHDRGWSGTGPAMPAGPMMVAIDAWMVREGLTEIQAAERIGTTDRRFRDWRQPGASTRMSLVDAALVAMDLLWFDLYDPSEFPEVAKIWDGE